MRGGRLSAAHSLFVLLRGAFIQTTVLVTDGFYILFAEQPYIQLFSIMHFSSTVMATAAIMSVADARPHGRYTEASGAQGSGSDSLLAGLLSDLNSLLSAIPTGGFNLPGLGSGSGSDPNAAAPTAGLELPNGGDEGFGGFLTISPQFPSGIFPTDGGAIPTGGAGLPTDGSDQSGFELPTPTATGDFGSVPTGGAGLPGLGESPSAPLGSLPTGGAAPTGGSGEISPPATTAPVTFIPGGDDLSTVSFVFASTAAPFGGNGGFGGNTGFGGNFGFGGLFGKNKK